MPNHHAFGRRGEALAAAHLQASGWKLLDRNFRFGHKEIDLVARRGHVIAFVEVKARASLRFGHPLAAITAAKRREIERVARAWIARHGDPRFVYRFDAVSITFTGDTPTLDHVEDAWRLP